MQREYRVQRGLDQPQQASWVAAGGGGGAGLTQAACELGADLELVQGLVVLQGLGVGVDRPELDALRWGKGDRARLRQNETARSTGRQPGRGAQALRVQGEAGWVTVPQSHRKAAGDHAVDGVAAAAAAADDCGVGGEGWQVLAMQVRRLSKNYENAQDAGENRKASISPLMRASPSGDSMARERETGVSRQRSGGGNRRPCRGAGRPTWLPPMLHTRFPSK